MNHFATIITQDHFDKAITLLKSLQRYSDSDVALHTLVVDPSIDVNTMKWDGIVTYPHHELMSDPINNIILTKYAGFSSHNKIDLPTGGIIAFHDYMRWALKPAFLKFLQVKHERLIYCDCDLYFYNKYQFLVDMLDEHRIVLSPHWREIRPVANTDYRYNFLHGLYNGGFIAVRDANDFLEWWREMCAIECTAESCNGTYVDQKYLDLVPLYFDDVGIIRHKGCNIAGWNRYGIERTATDHGILADGQEIVFIHYSPITIAKIEAGEDMLLQTHLDEYIKQLRNIRISLMDARLKTCISDSKPDKGTII
jgi:hypothetical protein